MKWPDYVVPHQKFKNRFMTNTRANEATNIVHHIVEFDFMDLLIFDSKLVVHQKRIPGTQQESETTLSFCEHISTMIKRPSLMSMGWITFVTPSYGVNHALLGTPLPRGHMEMAYYVADLVETMAATYRRTSKQC